MSQPGRGGVTGRIGPALAGLGLLLTFLGCAGCAHTPLFGGGPEAPWWFWCALAGLPLLVLGLGITIGTALGRWHPPPPTGGPGATTVRCQGCGVFNAARARFCNGCGAPLAGGERA